MPRSHRKRWKSPPGGNAIKYKVSLTEDPDELGNEVLGVPEKIEVRSVDDIFLPLDRASNVPSHSLKGKTVCFTGKFRDHTRSDMHDIALSIGMNPMTSMEYGTSILVVADTDWDDSSSRWTTKRVKAEKWGSEVMHERDFMEIVEQVRRSIRAPSHRRTQ